MGAVLKWAPNSKQHPKYGQSVNNHFFKSLFKNLLEIIYIKAQLHQINKCQKNPLQFKFKLSKIYKCLRERCKLKSNLLTRQSTALHHYFLNCSNDTFKFLKCIFESARHQLSRGKQLICSSSGAEIWAFEKVSHKQGYTQP